MQVDIRDTRAYRYAYHCCAEDKREVGVYVKRQAAKWLRIADGQDDRAYISRRLIERDARLLSLIIQPDLGAPLSRSLDDYAAFLETAIFTTLRREDDMRLYSTAVLEIGRKNHKTYNAGVLFIRHMLDAPQYARSFSVAPDYKLSSELRLAVAKTIKSSPELTEHFRILRDSVRCKLNNAEYMPLAYSTDRMDGKLAHIWLADEAGALDSYPLTAMRYSQIDLPEPLGIVISTQYPNDNNAMLDEIDAAKKAVDGLIDREDIFALLYEPDEDLIPAWETDDRVIWQANPVAVHSERMMTALRRAREMAILYENQKQDFLCKCCNIRFRGLGTEGYVDIDRVRACRREPDDGWWRGRDVWLGLDLSASDDNTAVAMVTEEDGAIYARAWCFYPRGREQTKSAREGLNYREMAIEGSAIPCGDMIIDYGAVEAFVLSLEERYGVRVVSLAYDRWNAISTVQKLEAAPNPIECVEVRQHSSVLHPPTKLLYEQIMEGRFRYDANRLLEINFSNARCTEDTNLNKYVNKKKSNGKVDMVMAIIDALRLCMDDALQPADDLVVFGV